MNTETDILLDTTGLLCPEPVMMLHNSVRDTAAGGIIQMLATDPSTQRDVPKFCQFLGHELLEQTQDGGTYRYRIRRGE